MSSRNNPVPYTGLLSDAFGLGFAVLAIAVLAIAALTALSGALVRALFQAPGGAWVFAEQAAD